MDKRTIIDELVRSAQEKGAFTGTWLYAENGEIVSKGAVGFRDPEDKLPMREDCVFDLASVTKQFTAAAVMLLRRRGLLDLDDEITKFFPEIPYAGVTVRHLLHHTGGLPDYMDWVDEISKKENTIPTNAVIVRFLRECGQPPVFVPGEKWEYSNTGYCLLAQIAEKVSGVPFEDFLRDEIFEPAGMHATRVYHRRKDKNTIHDLAYGLVLPLGGGTYRLPDDEADSGIVITCDGANGDGLVHSNIFDLFAWDRALREEKVLTKEEQALMYTPGRLGSGAVSGDPEDEDGDAYGFGWFVRNDPALGLVVCHSGGWPGYSNWYERYIDADRVLIILCCRDSFDERANDAFFKGMKAAANDKEPEPILAIEELEIKDPDRSDWEAFYGKYDFADADFRIDEVLPKDGGLYANVSYMGNESTLKLYPLGEKTFGFKDISGDITFNENGLTFWGEEHRKL